MVVRDSVTAQLEGMPVLVDFVRRAMLLVRAGHRHKAPCPFHNEKTPSFFVGNWWFVCYGCGAEGDIIDFAIRYYGLSERDAVEYVAAHHGIDVPTGNGGLCSPSRASVARTAHDVQLLIDLDDDLIPF